MKRMVITLCALMVVAWSATATATEGTPAQVCDSKKATVADLEKTKTGIEAEIVTIGDELMAGCNALGDACLQKGTRLFRATLCQVRIPPVDIPLVHDLRVSQVLAVGLCRCSITQAAVHVVGRRGRHGAGQEGPPPTRRRRTGGGQLQQSVQVLAPGHVQASHVPEPIAETAE